MTGPFRCRWFMAALLLAVPIFSAGPDYPAALRAIATEIEGLKAAFPQLADFSAQRNCSPGRLAIEYGFRTRQAARSGGWSAGVPNPDSDGVWLYIDFHDPASTAQIHTQPVVSTRIQAGEKEAFLLVLEGTATRSLAGRIWEIVRQSAARLAAGGHDAEAAAPPAWGKVVSPLGFHTIDFSRELWASLGAEQKLQGRVIDTLAWEQIRKVTVLRCAMAVPGGDFLETFIRRRFAEKNRFHAGPLPADSALGIYPPLITALLETESGPPALLTIRAFSVLEYRGRIGVIAAE